MDPREVEDIQAAVVWHIRTPRQKTTKQYSAHDRYVKALPKKTQRRPD